MQEEQKRRRLKYANDLINHQYKISNDINRKQIENLEFIDSEKNKERLLNM